MSISGFGIYDLQFARPPCTGVLAPGDHCVIVAFFNPLFDLMPANDPGAVTIVDSDVSSPQVIALTGRGTQEVTFSPASLSFPPQKVGTTSPAKIVTVTSTLQTKEGIFLDIFSSGDYSWVGTGKAPCVSGEILLPSCTMSVTFTPSRAGVINGAVTFDIYPLCNFGSCAKPSVLNLTGKGD